MNQVSTSPGALFLADNLALDFINTDYGVGDQHHDCLTKAQAVADWLREAGLLSGDADRKLPDGLLTEARELRECSRAVVNAAMKGGSVDLTAINQVLEAGHPTRRLQWDSQTHKFQAEVHQRNSSAAGLLWPLADALVNLVTSRKFEFVRQCEAHDCILLFHDLSKSHRRRWCSMATCGNRMKVSAFRSRQKAG